MTDDKLEFGTTALAHFVLMLRSKGMTDREIELLLKRSNVHDTLRIIGNETCTSPTDS